MAVSRIRRSTPRRPGQFSRETFGAMLDGLQAQGLPYEDALETLQEGLRQANGRPPKAQALNTTSGEQVA